MREYLRSAGGRTVLAVLSLLVLGACGVAAWHLGMSPPAPESIAAEAARARGGPGPGGPAPAAVGPAAGKSAPVTVYVTGEVARPGVYQLPRGARVADAIDAAGGLLPDADVRRLPNLAGRATDGKQVKVPRQGKASTGSSKVDINSATVEELMAVPGIDGAIAQAIVGQRESYGPFLSLTELHTLLGLDVQVVAALRAFLRVGRP